MSEKLCYGSEKENLFRGDERKRNSVMAELLQGKKRPCVCVSTLNKVTRKTPEWNEFYELEDRDYGYNSMTLAHTLYARLLVSVYQSILYHSYPLIFIMKGPIIYLIQWHMFSVGE